MTRHGLSAAERLREKISEDASTGCWNWTGTLARTGYGRLNLQYREWPAHRLSYETFVGPIAPGMHIDHLCRNRRCVNPAHLEVVTPVENQHRARLIGHDHPKAPATCKRGHDLDVVGVYYWHSKGRTGRNCVACRRERYLNSQQS